MNAPAPPAAATRAPVTQPALGLLGLLLVAPIAALLAVGAGPERSTLVLAPLVTYSLPLVAMVAFWWADWPGTRFAAGWSGWIDTAFVAAGAVVLTAVGQTLAGRLDVVALFDPAPGPGHVPTFPATLPLGGAAFVAMLEITLVGDGWPLATLPRRAAGLVAVAISWVIALGVYFGLTAIRPPAGSDVTMRSGAVPGSQLGAALIVISALQVLYFVLWRGWPFTLVAGHVQQALCAHAAVVGGGIAAYLLARFGMGLDAGRIAALAGCFVAGALGFGMLLDGWLPVALPEPTARAALFAAALGLTAVLAAVLSGVAHAVTFRRVTADDWIQHAALNAASTSIILHVAIGHRWPFRASGT